MKFKIQPVNVSESFYLGVLVVNGDIKYSENQFYKLLLIASVSNILLVKFNFLLIKHLNIYKLY